MSARRHHIYIYIIRGKLLHIMLAFFPAFHCGNSIEHYSSFLVVFSRKINIISTEYRNKNIFYEKMKT